MIIVAKLPSRYSPEHIDIVSTITLLKNKSWERPNTQRTNKAFIPILLRTTQKYHVPFMLTQDLGINVDLNTLTLCYIPYLFSILIVLDSGLLKTK